MMNVQWSINREIFSPRAERLLLVIQVRKRTRKRLTFSQRSDYATYLCLSVTNQKPPQVFITKVKRFESSPGFERRSQWSLEELRRVDGIHPEQDSAEFDLVFDGRSDQWVAGSIAEKRMFIQTLHQLSKNYWSSKTEVSSTAPPAGKTSPSTAAGPSATSEIQKKNRGAPNATDFINCETKLLRGSSSFSMLLYRCKIFLNRMKNSVSRTPEQSTIKKTPTGKAGRSSSSPPAPGIMGTAGGRKGAAVGERGGDKRPTGTSKK